MAGPLAEIYSASDTFKRKLVDALRNPAAKLEQVLGDANDRAGNLRTAMREAVDEDIATRNPLGNGPANQRLDEMIIGAYNPVGMTKFVLPKAEAFEAARKNAVKMLGLPESNTAMDRAKALGFDSASEMYHATDKDFSSFIPSIKGKLGAGVYMSPNSKYAEKYVDESARVLPVLTRGDYANESIRTEVADLIRDRMAKENPRFSVADWKKQIDLEMKGRGFAGADMQNLERTVYDPSNIRSRFAAFDPARVNENDLLAGMIPIGAIAGSDKAKEKTDEFVEALRRKK